MVTVQRRPHLFQVVQAFGAAGRFASLLYGWKDKSDKNSDDRNDHQQFDQGETVTAIHESECSQRGSTPLIANGTIVPFAADCTYGNEQGQATPHLPFAETLS